MFNTCGVIVIFTFITCVAGTINVDDIDKNVSQRTLTDLEKNINQTLNKLESNILDKLIAYIDGKVDAANKRTDDLEDKITQKLNTTIHIMAENFEGKITLALNSSNKKIEDNLEDKLKPILNEFDNMKKKLLKVNRSLLPCKEVSLTSNNRLSPYWMLNDTVNHVTMERNSTGHLTDLQMHIAVKADNFVGFRLMNKESELMSDIRYYIDVGQDSNQNTNIDIFSKSEYTSDVKNVNTPNILSSTQFKAFYVKIKNGNLKFGTEGDSSPLISYYDTNFSEVNYFYFSYWGSDKATVRYDCPAPLQGTKKRKKVILNTARISYWFA